MVFCDACNKARKLLPTEASMIIDETKEWKCDLIIKRMPAGCKEPDDELQEIVGRRYGAILQLLGIINRCDLARADIHLLAKAAGGVEFQPLIEEWVIAAQRKEIDDAMLLILDTEEMRSHFMSISVAAPGDLLEQTCSTWCALLSARCHVFVAEVLSNF